MKICIIIGSQTDEPKSRTLVASYVNTVFQQYSQHTVHTIDLSDGKLPFFGNEGEFWSGKGVLYEKWMPYKNILMECDAYIIITPEYHGMVPGRLKNFFLYVDGKTMSHKPALLIGVSAGRGGSYPIAEMRMSSHKNSRIVYIPDHVIVQNVNDVLKGDTPCSEADKYIRERIQYSISMLLSYAKWMKDMRGDPEFPFDLKKFPSGM